MTLDDVADWQHEVANGDTVLGLTDWVEHRRAADGLPPLDPNWTDIAHDAHDRLLVRIAVLRYADASWRHGTKKNDRIRQERLAAHAEVASTALNMFRCPADFVQAVEAATVTVDAGGVLTLVGNYDHLVERPEVAQAIEEVLEASSAYRAQAAAAAAAALTAAARQEEELAHLLAQIADRNRTP